MSSNTKDRLLHDLEALRHQLAEIEASGPDDLAGIPTLEAIPTLQADNIPLLGDALPANKQEAIQAHRNAMAQLDAELKGLDNKEQQSSASNDAAASDQNAYDVSPVLNESTTEANNTAQEEHTAHSENIVANDKISSSNEVDNTEARTSKTADNTQIAQGEEHEAPANDSNIGKDDIEPLMAASLKQLSHPDQPTSSKQPELEPIIDPAAAVISSLTHQARKPQGEDNPFLPAHLRERLNQSKSSLLEEIARSSESLDASTALLRNVTGSPQEAHSAQAEDAHSEVAAEEYQLLVDSLVSKYLPLIEADLRQRLNTALKKQLQGEPA